MRVTPQLHVFASLFVRAQLSVVYFIVFYVLILRIMKRIMVSALLEMLCRRGSNSFRPQRLERKRA